MKEKPECHLCEQKMLYLEPGMRHTECRLGYSLTEGKCVKTKDLKTGDDTEYIRADLAELTWEDIEKIDGLIREVGQRTDIKTYQETYQEVLRRFLESKRK